MFHSLPLWALLTIFLVSAGLVWVAGIYLSNSSGILAQRFHLGQALGGLILLAFATNLPEAAIAVSGAFAAHFGIVIGNILGGIAIQTVVLVAMDGFGIPDAPFTYRAASLTLVLEGVLLLGVLAVAIMGTQLPASLIEARLSPGALLITVLWIVGLWLTRQAQVDLPWEESGNDIALHFGISGVLFGSIFLAAVTSLPDLSTGLAAVKVGDYKLAFSDIFGGNAFLPVLFLVATLISGQAVLPRAQATDIYLTSLGALLTMVYIVGLIFRPRRQYFRLGPDSLSVLVLYLLGIFGLIAIVQGS
jgi:cation:H+ antiporter